MTVSINSTSEEVRSLVTTSTPEEYILLVSINSTSEEVRSSVLLCFLFRCHPVSINSTSEEVRRGSPGNGCKSNHWFPLIQLPRKSEVKRLDPDYGKDYGVSINSTSEEVRRVTP